jgi:hypothetical protein
MKQTLKQMFPNEFPEKECTVPDKREPDVFMSESFHWVLLEDLRFEDEFTIKHLKPYTCKNIDDENELLFGWVDKDGNIYAHYIKPINLDDMRVVGAQK